MPDHVSLTASWNVDEKKLVFDRPADYMAGLKRMKPGAGERFVVRIEREEAAYTYADLKHYWGHVVTPLSEWNGDFKEDWHLRLKADFMPEGKTSLIQLNREELKEYTLRCEVYAHGTHPEAFTLYDVARRA